VSTERCASYLLREFLANEGADLASRRPLPCAEGELAGFLLGVDACDRGQQERAPHQYRAGKPYSWLLNTIGWRALWSMALANDRFYHLPDVLVRTAEAAMAHANESGARMARRLYVPVGSPAGRPFALAVHVGGDRSEVCADLSTWIDQPAALIMLDTADDEGRVAVSFRDGSGQGLARAIAQEYDGGGHPNAAGCVVPLTQAVGAWLEGLEQFRTP
jgi:hypothetical protein